MRDRDRERAGLCNSRNSHKYDEAPSVDDNADKEKSKDFRASNSPSANSALSGKIAYWDEP